MMRENRVQNGLMSKSMKGSFTIEAAIVLPVIVYLLLLTVYMAFYLYSSYVLSMNAYISVFRGSRANLLQENAHRITEKSIQNYLQEELPAIGDIEYDIQSTMWKHQIEIEGKVRIPFMQSVIDSLLPVHITRYAERTEPALFLRSCRKVQALLTERQDI